MPRTGLAIAVWIALCLPGWAQMPFVPPESYNRTRPDFGNTLPLCVIPTSATLTQDRAVAERIAQALLLEPAIIEMDVDMDMLDAEGIWPAVFLHLAEQCVGVLGVQLVPGTMIPDWLTITRPYFSAPYVLVDLKGDAGSLAALPPDARLGVPIRTALDNEVLNLIAAGGDFGRLRRRPYDRPGTLDLLIAADALDAAIVWTPHLDTGLLAQREIVPQSVAPLGEDTRQLGIVLRSQDEMLRTLIDDAIAALEAEGALTLAPQ